MVALPLPLSGPRFPEQRDGVTLHHEPDVQEREHGERRQQRHQHAPRERRRARLEDDRLGMQRAEQVDAQVDEGEQDETADSQHRRVAGPQPRLRDGPPEQQVAYKEEEEEQGEREPSVPRPPRAPNRLRPDRPGREHHEGKRRPHLRGSGGEAVEPRVPYEQVQNAAEPNQPHGGHARQVGGTWEEEAFLPRPREALTRREGEAPHQPIRSQPQPNPRNPPAPLPNRPSS